MRNKLTFEEFVNQHDGLCLIMELQGLTVNDLKECLMEGITARVSARRLSEEEYYSKQTEQGYYGK